MTRRKRDASASRSVGAVARRVGAALAAGVLAAAVLTAGPGCANRAASPAPAPTPASFLVRPGDQFDVRLEANPSTGYRWDLGRPLDESIVKLVGSDYQREPAPAGGAAPVGQAGLETWRFEAVAPGRTMVELVYRRPWETASAPARVVLYSVEVR